MKLSIIIPVYNVEKYLPKCLDSCMLQDIPQSAYEIIVVNDGSPDNSLSIINDYKQRYDNIVVINKDNGGLSSARNAGMKIAKGDYIWFVDSDDWISENSLGRLTKIMLQNPDLIVLNTILHIDDTERSIIRDFVPGVVYEGREVYLRGFLFPYSGAPFYLFNRQFLESHGLQFEEGIYFEDLLFASEVLSLTKSCISIKEPMYHYRIRANSITTSAINEKKLLDMFAVMDLQFHWKVNQSNNDQTVMSDAICKTANYLFRRYILKIKRQERRKWYRELKARTYWWSCVKQSGGFKNHTYYFLFFLASLFC